MTTIQERLITRLGGILPGEFNERISELAGEIDVLTERIEHAWEAGYVDGWSDPNDDPQEGDLKTIGYRVMSGQLHDFSSTNREKVYRMLWTLLESSLLANRLLKIKRDHIVGIGSKAQSDDEPTQKVIDLNWKRNKMSRFQSQICFQLFLFGEQCITAFARETDGAIKHGYIDPREIERVVTHPDNVLERRAIVLKKKAPSPDAWINNTDEREVYFIIREADTITKNGKAVSSRHAGRLVMHTQIEKEDWEVKMLQHFGLLDYTGSCLFETVNNTSNQTRGVSDLQQALDWIDQAESTLFAIAERERFSSFFSWFVKLIGVQRESKQWKNAVTSIKKSKIKRGSVNVTNDSEDWELKVPDLKQTGSVAAFTAILTFIMGGLGFPLSWYGFGNETNRSTLDKQADPTEKSLEYDQSIFREYMLSIFTFWVDQAAIRNKIKDTEAEIEYDLPVVNQENVVEALEPFVKAVTAIAASKEADLLTDETEMMVMARVLKELNIEINPTEELKDVLEAIEKKKLEQEEENNRNLSAQLAMQGDQEEEPNDDEENQAIQEFVNGIA